MKGISDTFVATTLMIIGIVVTSSAYVTLKSAEDPAVTLAPSIPEGKHHYAVIQNEKCVGTILTELSHEQEYHFFSLSELRIKDAERKFKVKLSFEGFFNPLGQLTASKVNFFSPGVSAVVSSKEINPMKVEADLSILGNKRYLPFEIPGPLLIHETVPGEFRLVHTRLPKTQGGMLQSIQSVRKDLFDLVVEEREETDTECADKEYALDVSQLQSSLPALFQSVPLPLKDKELK